MTLTLCQLPKELLLRVASCLDSSSACALARTCKALQAVSEVAVYRGLNLSTSVTHASPDDIRLYASRKLYNIRFALHGNHIDGLMAASLRYATLLRKVVGFLHTHPIRRRSITALQIDYDSVCPTKLQELLEMLAPTLRHLEVNKPTYPILVAPRTGWLQYDKMINSLKTHLSSLRSLRFCYDERWDARLVALLRKAPNLQELQLIPNTPWCNGWVQRAILVPEKANRRWPQLRLLRVLQVDEMDAHLSNLLTRLVNGAPDLECVLLRDLSLNWRPTSNDPLLKALGDSKCLKYLGVSPACRGAFNIRGRFEALEVLSEGDCMVREAPLLSTIALPMLPRLKRFLNWHQEGPPGVDWPYDALNRCIPAAVEPVPGSLLPQIVGAPGLECIHFNKGCANEGVLPSDREQATEYWTSTEALDNRERVLLIRTYVTNTGLTLTHCRGFNTREPSDKQYDPRRVLSLWQEYSDFQGHCVGTDLLNQVYVLLGEPKEWIEPARGLALPQAAWQLLEDFHASCQADSARQAKIEQAIGRSEEATEYLRMEV